MLLDVGMVLEPAGVVDVDGTVDEAVVDSGFGATGATPGTTRAPGADGRILKATLACCPAAIVTLSSAYPNAGCQARR